MMKMPLVGMTLAQLQDVVLSLGMPRFTAKQLAEWIYVHRATDFSQMNNISKSNRALLQQTCTLGLEAPVKEQRSIDGTAKYLFNVGDGQAVESVMIPDDDRATLCISSQKGCRMNCYFCMTGKQGFHGHLTANQIINQVLSVPESQQLTNVVFMGMGEPMDNLDAVMQAVEVLTASWGLAWSPKRITVSSIGKLRELQRLVEETHVHIAISVHSPFSAERAGIMPVEKAYPIHKVMQMLSRYDFAHQRRLSVEYIMFNGLNDDLEHAQALAQLLQHNTVRVNLIRFHAIPGVNLKTSDEQRMTEFRDYLNSQGIICTIRRSRGEDIFAACGMLAGKNKKK
ncbi:MAG: 23S rRNA (adenine(2503)-C(2))-methyltransferase RlmN [Muribaculaceae bacterium]